MGESIGGDRQYGNMEGKRQTRNHTDKGGRAWSGKSEGGTATEKLWCHHSPQRTSGENKKKAEILAGVRRMILAAFEFESSVTSLLA